jgi:telomere length regulation protein
MLNTSTREKVQRPVYLMQLLELLRARTEPEKLEVALRWGEELIRRKRDYGTELGKHNWEKSRPGSKISCNCLFCLFTDENAEELVHQALALSDPYDLEDFEKRRQEIVIALTACSPRIVAP